MASTESEARGPRSAAPTSPPKRLFYKIGNVCDLTGTQPYILRFWESEFPQLAPQKSRSGQRLFRERDIETVRRIKKLLYEEGYTIAGARKRLEQEEAERPPEERAAPPAEEPAPSAPTPAPGPAEAAARAPRTPRGEARASRQLQRTVKSLRRELETLLRRLEPRRS